LTKEELLKKSQQAEKRKKQKEEQMVEQKDAILRKYASAMTARLDRPGDLDAKERVGKERPLSDIRYITSNSGTFLSFAPHVSVPECLTQKITEEKRDLHSIMCCIPHCTNSRRYYDSKTQQPLCSLNCYKKLHSLENKAL